MKSIFDMTDEEINAWGEEELGKLSGEYDD